MTPEQRREYMKAWLAAHPGYRKAYNRQRSLNNKCRQQKLDYARNKYRTDEQYRERALRRSREQYQRLKDNKQAS